MAVAVSTGEPGTPLLLAVRFSAALLASLNLGTATHTKHEGSGRFDRRPRAPRVNGRNQCQAGVARRRDSG